MSPSRDSYVVYLDQTYLQSFPALRKCVGTSLWLIPSVLTTKLSQQHMAGEESV